MKTLLPRTYKYVIREYIDAFIIVVFLFCN